MKIWIDADSCPVKIREIIENAAVRTSIPLVLVANRSIPHRKSIIITDVIVEEGPDSADDYIIDNAGEFDIVITRDIPLAHELVKRNVSVINDRGSYYTKENVGERLSIRNIMLLMRDSGMKINEETSFSLKDIQNFANTFDSLLTKRIKLYKKSLLN
ncbi:MAG: YaiI/YqxD family protein [Spirochaetia bacterium]|jgi:uncharacterized protein YaiI (UPF0178 family)|nr:YaiI/YqxD family protein [Spirochaetia bacterium]